MGQDVKDQSTADAVCAHDVCLVSQGLAEGDADSGTRGGAERGGN